MSSQLGSKYKFNLNNSLNNNHNQLCPMQLQGSQNYVAGDVCLGKFTPTIDDSGGESSPFGPPNQANYFENQAHWNHAKREKVKKFRFVVCTLSLFALALSVMSRSLFNISIVEMTKDVGAHPEQQQQQQPSESDIFTEMTTMVQQIPQVVQTLQMGEEPANSSHEVVSVFTVNDSDDENPEAGLHFSWSVRATNFLLSAFFIGYAPSMFFSGGIAEQYGSVLLLSVCVVGSALINAFTPFMASFSYYSLAGTRIVLGMLQGPLVPACYDLFNRWLTMTEMSFFVPLIKVSMAMGTLAGTMLPGVVLLSGHDWTYNFYIGGLVCIIWALLWFPLATSEPQTNRWIGEDELRRIMRKKSTALAVIKLESGETKSSQPAAKKETKTSIPWMLIITSPSVLVLTFVKFTYNLGMDFLIIESAIYLSQIHEASTETVALIASSGCIMQMVLISFVGGLATYLVRNRSFGFSKTNWRKIFQGTSNFAMALIFCLIPFVGRDQFLLVAVLFLLIYFFWMFGAGGESMIPYDLSPKYPATIMGFAHSLSILSGFALPSVCSLVLGDDKKDPARWNLLFLIIGIALAAGGLAFVAIIKAKPFLASERAKYDQSQMAK